MDLLHQPPIVYILAAIAMFLWALVFYSIGKAVGKEIERKKIIKQHDSIRILKIDRKINKYQLANLPIMYKTENEYIKQVQVNCINSVLEGIKTEHFHQSIHSHMDGDVTVSASLKIVLPCKKEM